jgi:uncharacterized membrane protein
VLVRTVLGVGTVIAIIIGIALLATVFGGIDLTDFNTQLAVGLVLLGVGAGYWTLKPQIDRRVANRPTGVKPKRGMLLPTSESKLDDLIKEIDSFVIGWREGSGILAGYRTYIQKRKMFTTRKKIKEHSTKIRKKIKPLRRLSYSKTILDSLIIILDKMFALGQEIESTFASNISSNELLRMEQDRIDHLVSEGDNICQELMDVVSKLESLR